MLTNLPPIRDQFGQYYRICSPMDAPATIQPRDCLDEFMTRQFLHSVDAPFGLWGNLLHRYDLSGSDRKSTRLNSSHVAISYAVFSLKKKNTVIDTWSASILDTVNPSQPSH